jgi:AraC-like DNA-binding protein
VSDSQSGMETATRQPSAIDLRRAERLIGAMYREPQTPLGILLDRQGESLGCCRRQLERGLRTLGTTPAPQLSEIRCELAAGALMAIGPYVSLSAVATSVGYPDTRALREKIGEAFGISPRDLIYARSLELHISHAEEAGRRFGGRVLLGADADLRASREDLRLLLTDVPVRTRRLLDGTLVMPTPAQASADAGTLAKERIGKLRAASGAGSGPVS